MQQKIVNINNGAVFDTGESCNNIKFSQIHSVIYVSVFKTKQRDKDLQVGLYWTAVVHWSLPSVLQSAVGVCEFQSGTFSPSSLLEIPPHV